MFHQISKYGIFLNEQEANDFASEYLRKNPEAEIGDVFYGFPKDVAFVIDDSYVSGGMGYCGDIEYIASGKQEAVPFGGFMLCLEKQGGAFAESGELYNSLEEMAAEIESKWGEYLPDGFDYISHLAYVNSARWV